MSRFGKEEDNESGNESPDIKEMKRNVSKNIEYLRTCTDYTSKKALEALRELIGVTVACHDHRQKVITAHAVDKHYPQLFTKMWESLAGFIARQHLDGFYNLDAMVTTYLNFTDNSSDFSSELGKTDCIPILIRVLDNYQQDLMSDNILACIILLLANTVQNFPDNIRVFRRANAVPVLKKFLHLENQAVQTYAVLLLAFIANETETGLLQTVDGAVILLVSMIKVAIHNGNEDHCVQWGSIAASALDLIRSLNKLAVNDTNKVEIANHGGIHIFIRMLQDDFSEDEHIAAVKALWNLAFIEELRKSTELQESIKSLERLVISSSQELQHACTYAMWQIKGTTPAAKPEPRSLPTYEEAISQPNPQLPVVKAQPHHTTQIMISYQWDNQKETLKIREKLTEAGYKVWMDITHMRGSLLEAMSEAVEKSSIILVCLSEKYKNSTCCRAEAEYAFVLEKTVIPLRMDDEYTPDGWLGILGRGKLYHKFYSVDQVEYSMEGLLKDIAGAFGTDDVDDEVDGPVKPTKQDDLHSSTRPCQNKELVRGLEKTSASQWSREDVQTWLKDNELTDLCETFRRCRGCHLEEMFSSCGEDKRAFNDELKSDYGIGNAQMRMEFVVALKEAFK